MLENDIETLENDPKPTKWKQKQLARLKMEEEWEQERMKLLEQFGQNDF